jgi:hypothetical protein
MEATYLPAVRTSQQELDGNGCRQVSRQTATTPSLADVFNLTQPESRNPLPLNKLVSQ